MPYLNLKYKTEANYNKVKKFFANDSSFTPDIENGKLMLFQFWCDNELCADNVEEGILEELEMFKEPIGLFEYEE